ncbi:cysteine desulfurase [Ktedonobacter sp. SOSP1-85]|uniref:aminotransferase class V-fold PLP-dependent enzyme n=1 Tax=Ktedonobacter sp. SOSP1-85 TaxID=2778367 RepID=UPI001916ADDB|nr:aminotransferase class V-fold PLP-dependent enzyme [Ktedonobacter sp. SOSP1-85]GHO75234.1 cysteine desulfurase [Ktedonobacter sp. SOSP1-85]
MEEQEPIYLDNAATTFPKPESVYVEANSFYMKQGGNAGRGGNPFARASTRMLTETRELLADWLEAPSADSVIFTASATHALNQAIFGANFYPGDIIYVTPFEHNSVLRPVEHLRQSKGVQVRQIPFGQRTFTCQLDKLTAAFQSEPPTMVCVTHASNVCGVMPPVAEIAKLAKQSNPEVIIIVDGAQTAGLYPIDLKSGLIDAFIFSGHKSLYGPFGIAGFVLGSNWKPNPLLFGGTGTFSESIDMPMSLPSAYEAGSHNILAIAGLHAALTWLQKNGRKSIVEHSINLAEQIREKLMSLPNVEVYTPHTSTSWCGIISLTIAASSPQAVEAALGAKGIAVRAGLHCAPWTHKWLGTLENGGTVRVSPGYFNDFQDADAIISALRTIAC